MSIGASNSSTNGMSNMRSSSGVLGGDPTTPGKLTPQWLLDASKNSALVDGPRTAPLGSKRDGDDAPRQPGSARRGDGPSAGFGSGHFGSQQQQGDRWGGGGGGPNDMGPRGGSIDGGPMANRRGWRDEERPIPSHRDGPPPNPRWSNAHKDEGGGPNGWPGDQRHSLDRHHPEFGSSNHPGQGDRWSVDAPQKPGPGGPRGQPHFQGGRGAGGPPPERWVSGPQGDRGDRWTSGGGQQRWGASGHDQDPRGGGNWHGPEGRRHGLSAPGFGGPPAFHGGYGPEGRGPAAGPGGAPLEAGRGRGFSMGRGRGGPRGPPGSIGAPSQERWGSSAPPSRPHDSAPSTSPSTSPSGGKSSAAHRYERSEALRVLEGLREKGELALPRDVNTEDPALLAKAGEVDVERQLAARVDTWHADGEGAPDLNRLSLDAGPSPGKASVAAAGGNDAKAAAEVAASAAASAAPPPEDDEWMYRDPKGRMQGPFPRSDILAWFDDGFFPADLPIRAASDPDTAPFRPLSTMMRVWGGTGGAPPGFEQPAAAQQPAYEQQQQQPAPQAAPQPETVQQPQASAPQMQQPGAPSSMAPAQAAVTRAESLLAKSEPQQERQLSLQQQASQQLPQQAPEQQPQQQPFFEQQQPPQPVQQVQHAGNGALADFDIGQLLNNRSSELSPPQAAFLQQQLLGGQGSGTLPAFPGMHMQPQQQQQQPPQQHLFPGVDHQQHHQQPQQPPQQQRLFPGFDHQQHSQQQALQQLQLQQQGQQQGQQQQQQPGLPGSLSQGLMLQPGGPSQAPQQPPQQPLPFFEQPRQQQPQQQPQWQSGGSSPELFGSAAGALQQKPRLSAFERMRQGASPAPEAPQGPSGAAAGGGDADDLLQLFMPPSQQVAQQQHLQQQAARQQQAPGQQTYPQLPDELIEGRQGAPAIPEWLPPQHQQQQQQAPQQPQLPQQQAQQQVQRQASGPQPQSAAPWLQPQPQPPRGTPSALAHAPPASQHVQQPPPQQQWSPAPGPPQPQPQQQPPQQPPQQWQPPSPPQQPPPPPPPREERSPHAQPQQREQLEPVQWPEQPPSPSHQEAPVARAAPPAPWAGRAPEGPPPGRSLREIQQEEARIAAQRRAAAEAAGQAAQPAGAAWAKVAAGSNATSGAGVDMREVLAQEERRRASQPVPEYSPPVQAGWGGRPAPSPPGAAQRSLTEIQEAEIAEQRRMAAALKAEFSAKRAASGGAAPTEEEMFWDYGQAALQQGAATQQQQQRPQAKAAGGAWGGQPQQQQQVQQQTSRAMTQQQQPRQQPASNGRAAAAAAATAAAAAPAPDEAGSSLSPGFREWCRGQMLALRRDPDLTLVEFLMGVPSAGETMEYIDLYLKDDVKQKSARDAFANEFLKRKLEEQAPKRRKKGSGVGSSAPSQPAALVATAPASETWAKVPKSQKKKQKGKSLTGQQLGFSSGVNFAALEGRE